MTNQCTFDNCDRKYLAKGLCRPHYMQHRRGGGLTPIGPAAGTGRIGVANPGWRGDEIGYEAAHMRVRRARRGAGEHSCVDCGGQAAEWSYRGGCPRERRGPNTSGIVMAYSPNSSMYEPRCKPCHSRYDKVTS